MTNYDKEVIASAMEHSAGLPTAMQSAFIEGVKFVLERYIVSSVSTPSERVANAHSDIYACYHEAYLKECLERGVDADADEYVRWLRGG